jgi:hypothetical protein
LFLHLSFCLELDHTPRQPLLLANQICSSLCFLIPENPPRKNGIGISPIDKERKFFLEQVLSLFLLIKNTPDYIPQVGVATSERDRRHMNQLDYEDI